MTAPGAPAPEGTDPAVGDGPVSRLLVALLAAVVALPLVVAVVAMRRPQWAPVLDLAMTELRVRDVGGSHTPLVGLPGRIGSFAEQGSHPGPLSFYLLTPTYRLLGSSAWALQVAATVIHVTAVGVALVVARRRGGLVLVLAVAAGLTVLTMGYGAGPLTEPWNPYLPLVWWVVLLLSVWSIACGDLPMLPVAVAAASFAGQTHIPYLALGLGLGAVVAVLVARHLRSGLTRAERADAQRWVASALLIGVALWVPPTIDQLRHDPGNYRILVDHFATPPEDEPVVGLADATRHVFQHLDVVHLAVDVPADPGTLIPGSISRPARPGYGQVVAALWVVAAVGALALRHRALIALHAVIATALVLAVLSVSRIFGFVWFYLMLWIWGIAALMVIATGWTAAVALGRHLPARSTATLAKVGAAALAAVVVAGSVRSVAAAPDAHQSDHLLSDVLVALVPGTVAALDDLDGGDGQYLVAWDDRTHIGSQGYGLLSELEREGFDVGGVERYQVPLTPHRVLDPAEADAKVTLVTGSRIDAWRALPGAVEAAYHDPRTDAHEAEEAALRTAVADELRELGLAELIPLMDDNLFGLSIDVRLPFHTQLRLARLVELGVPTAVFVTPPDVEP